MSNLELVNTAQLRAELLVIKGIGRETADSILLYALGRPVFVVDAYTARIAMRHKLIDPGADYEQLRELFESNLTEDVQLFNECHALLVRLGKEFCRPKAKCPGCPLEELPHTIDIEYY
jgi:endonuclease-3 related protein